jgi:hypothetical protein
MLDRDRCIGEWEELWRLASRVASMQHVQNHEPSREPLQLMVGALVYHRRALRGFSETTLHESVRQEFSGTTDLLSISEIDLLDAGTDALPALGGIHLASGALRLPAAILETIEARPRARVHFEGLYGEMQKDGSFDWGRGECSSLFGSRAFQTHCEDSPIDLHAALVLLLLFREDFGHGEEGKGATGAPASGRRRWIEKRKSALDGISRCRVFEAQRLLIKWGLTTLEQPI